MLPVLYTVRNMPTCLHGSLKSRDVHLPFVYLYDLAIRICIFHLIPMEEGRYRIDTTLSNLSKLVVSNVPHAIHQL